VGRKRHIAVERGCAADCRSLHDDEAGALEMVDKALGYDPRHDLSGVMFPLSAIGPERERQGVGEVFGRRGLEAIGRVGHA